MMIWIWKKYGYKLADCFECLKIKKFYKKSGRRPYVWMEIIPWIMHVAFDKRKSNVSFATIRAFCKGRASFKGFKGGNRQEAGRGSGFQASTTEKGSLADH
ncbi:hypothetical protein Tco_0685689 [Tanacetum coccineum]